MLRLLDPKLHSGGVVRADWLVRGFPIERILTPLVLWLLSLALAATLLGCSRATAPPSHPPTTPAPAVTPAPTPTPIPTPIATPVPAPLTVEVPITVQGAASLGSLQLALRYDPQVLELQGVRAGPLARNTLVDFKGNVPGQAIIGLVDASGISGDGAILTLVFRPTGRPGASALTLERVEAANTSLQDLVVQSSTGQFPGAGASVTGPVLTFRQ